MQLDAFLRAGMKIKSMKAEKGGSERERMKRREDSASLSSPRFSRAPDFLYFSFWRILSFFLPFVPARNAARATGTLHSNNDERERRCKDGRTCKRARAADAPRQMQLMRLLDLATRFPRGPRNKRERENDSQMREEGRGGGGGRLGNFKSALIYRWKRKWRRKLRFSAFVFDLIFNHREKNTARLIERRPLWIGHRGIVWRKDASGASSTSDVAANRCLNTSTSLVLVLFIARYLADYCPISPALRFTVRAFRLENPHIYRTIKYYNCRYLPVYLLTNRSNILFLPTSGNRRHFLQKTFICEIIEIKAISNKMVHYWK